MAVGQRPNEPILVNENLQEDGISADQQERQSHVLETLMTKVLARNMNFN